MSTQPMLSDRAIQLIAENKILAAYEAGEFDNLPGFGQPCPLIDEAYDPHWWIRHKLKNEQLTAVQFEARAMGWTAGATKEDIIAHNKKSIDRERLRYNLELSVAERIRLAAGALKAALRRDSNDIGC